MSMPPPAKLMSADEFEAFIARPENRQRRFQLMHGELVEKVPTQLHAYIAGKFYRAIDTFLDQHPIGYVYVEARYRPVGDTNNDRLPDVSFSTSPEIVRKGPAAGMPDLVIKIQSPDDDLKDLIEDASFYLAHGSKMVCLVLADKRVMMVITPDSIQLLTDRDTFEGGSGLPGFTLPLANIFPLQP